MAAEKESPKEKEKPDAAAPAKAGQGGWLPVIVILVLVPALSYAMAEFVLFPRLEQRIAAATAAAGAEHAAAENPADPKGEKPKGDPTFSYEFKDIVSNLAGSMKSRYIKVSFTAYSSNPDLAKIIEANKAKLLDTTLSVLSALAISDLEDSTVKNKVRNELVFSYESVLKGRVIEEIYFSEFVIQ
jgi:flagellar FliL protein